MAQEETHIRGSRVGLLQRLKENLSRAYDLDEEQVARLVKTAVANINGELTKLEFVAKQQDIEQVKAIAHSLKGVLLNLRLKEQAAIAERLQHLDTVKKSSDTHQLVNRLQESLGEFVG